MKQSIPSYRSLVIGLFLICVHLRVSAVPLFAQPADSSWQATGRKGAVAAGGQGAVNAGIEVLKNGGNAIDGAVATILALSVPDSRAFCFGGEVPIMVSAARRKVVEVLSGQGAAPRLATR